MLSFEDLNLNQLKQIIREYNLITKISLSKNKKPKTKLELIADIKNHLFIDEEGLIKFIEKEDTNIGIPKKQTKPKKDIFISDEQKRIIFEIDQINKWLNETGPNKFISIRDELLKKINQGKEDIKFYKKELKKPLNEQKNKMGFKSTLAPDEIKFIKRDTIIFKNQLKNLQKQYNENVRKDKKELKQLKKKLNLLKKKNKVEKKETLDIDEIKKFIEESNLNLSKSKARREEQDKKYKEIISKIEALKEVKPKDDYKFEDINSVSENEHELALAMEDSPYSFIEPLVQEARRVFNRNKINMNNYEKYIDRVKFVYNREKVKKKVELKQKEEPTLIKDDEKFLKEKIKTLKSEIKFFGDSKDKQLLDKKKSLEKTLNDYENRLQALKGSGKSQPYALHAVIVHKPINLEDAKKIAQDFIKDKKKKYFRETSTSYRFRNIPKQKFISKSYRTKKINKEVSLIYGELKPEFIHLEGSGIFDFFKKGVEKVKEFFSPRLDDYNNTSKKTLKQYGDLPIKSLTIYRTPINSLIDTALNAISFGKFSELKKKYGFDKLFHLALVANVGDKNVIIEKNETVNIDTSYKTSSDTQTFNIPLGGRNITINQMLETARKKVGDKTFFDYDAFKNNCQFFIRYLLEGQGLYTKQAEGFLFQDVEGIYKGLPSYVSKVAKAITTTGAVISKIRGKGKIKQKKYSNLEGEGLFDDIKEGVKKKFDEFKSKKSMFDGFEPLIESLTPVYNEGLQRQPGIRVQNSSRMPPEKVLAEMADKSYKSSGREVDGYELLKQTTTLSFYKKNDTIIIVFRGTDVKDYGDLVADLSIALNNLNKSNRYKTDLEEIKKFQQEYSPSKYYYVGVGHSLGGGLLDEFINNGMIKEGLSFNPAVQKKDYEKDNKHRRIYLSNDPLYKIVGSFSKFHEVRKKDLDIGASHSISNFL